jgi:hypothetical protein
LERDKKIQTQGETERQVEIDKVRDRGYRNSEIHALEKRDKKRHRDRDRH